MELLMMEMCLPGGSDWFPGFEFLCGCGLWSCEAESRKSMEWSSGGCWKVYRWRADRLLHRHGGRRARHYQSWDLIQRTSLSLESTRRNKAQGAESGTLLRTPYIVKTQALEDYPLTPLVDFSRWCAGICVMISTCTSSVQQQEVSVTGVRDTNSLASNGGETVEVDD